MVPAYDVPKIKFATGNPTWSRAVYLYELGKVTQCKKTDGIFSAVVIGSNSYEVWVSSEKFDVGECNCYVGQKEELCKHMVAVAIHAAAAGQPLSETDKEMQSEPLCSGRIGPLSKDELLSTQSAIKVVMKFIKAYRGPSRMWFAYQGGLAEGCNRLSAVFSKLPVCEEAARMVIQTLLKLDKKLCQGGVDDSDGTVGGFIESAVKMLEQFAALEPSCLGQFKILEDRETCFDWQEPLLKLARE
ncbi:hypothetical protein HY969_03310 [Candidatus Kaiserbacteria bacterium]|nr:hypothetical protein [Candidatus Kaiserbacteria bacterium]